MNKLRILGVAGCASVVSVTIQILAIGCTGTAGHSAADASTGTASGTYTGNSTGVGTGSVTSTGATTDTCKSTGTHTSTFDGPGYNECGVWICGIAGPNCGTTCKDLNKDPSNCGACGVACASNQVCFAGKCGTATATATGT